jgi:hypothetical protein
MLNPDPDPDTVLNSDPDPDKDCGIRIQIQTKKNLMYRTIGNIYLIKNCHTVYVY